MGFVFVLVAYPFLDPAVRENCGLLALLEASLGERSPSGTWALACEKKVPFRCNLGLRASWALASILAILGHDPV